MKKYSSLILCVITCSLLSGCMSGLSYRKTSDARLANIAQGKLSDAMPSGDSDSVLYNVEAGSLLRLQQNYKKSNEYFGNAQQIIEVWNNSWKNSTSGEMTSSLMSMLVNDNVNDYEAKGFEKSFVATFSAMNQLDLNDLDNARVAIKQMYETETAIENYRAALYNAARQDKKKNDQDKLHSYLYHQLITKYNFQDVGSSAVLKLRNSYQNAFGHYLAGFVFEALNEPSLARPGYVKAGQLNPTNRLIQQSIDNIDSGAQPKAGYTDLLIVQTVGHAPEIESIQKAMPVNLSQVDAKNACIQSLNIFYPKLILDKDNKPSYNYSIDNSSITPLPMTNVNLMAQRALQDEMPHIIFRNISAMIRDIATAKLACAENKNNSGLAGALSVGAMFAGRFLDRADERAWVLLPAQININRMKLKYGKHTISVKINGVEHKVTFMLTQPYQVVAYRIIGDQVFFELEQSMGAQ